MSVMKKTMLAAVILAGAGMNVAQAGVNGSGISATAELVFASSANISNTITPFSNLSSGGYSSDVVVARGMVHSLDGISHVYAVKFGPDLEPLEGSSQVTAIATGKNDNTNKLILSLTGSSKKSSAYPKDGYLIIGAYGATDKPIKTSTYSIVMNRGQTIAADTYTVSTVAYTYTS